VPALRRHSCNSRDANGNTQVVFNVLNSADQSAVQALPSGPVKTAFDTLSRPEQMWASLKLSTFSGKKERIAFGSTTLRTHLRAIYSHPGVLFGACRRTKFVLASMDVGADVSKYALEKKFAIAKLIHKIVTTALKFGAGFVPMGGAAASAAIGVVSELVDSAIDGIKEKKDRKVAAASLPYRCLRLSEPCTQLAVQDILLQLLSNMIPPKEDTPVRERIALPSTRCLTSPQVVESMLAASAAQNQQIIAALQALQQEQNIALRQRRRTGRGKKRRFQSVRAPAERYSFQEVLLHQCS
jgi:hypothetical protein